jgi:CRISPR-associated protein Cas1
MSQPLAIHSLHALAYCERLFYLENVEFVRVADERVYAGRRLHVEIERNEEEGDLLTMQLESQKFGLVGKVDCLRRRDGQLIPYEHKRGRSARSPTGQAEAWWTDKLQIYAYAALVEEHAGRPIGEGRIRYHADNVMVRVPIDEEAYRVLDQSITRARELQTQVARPPVALNERLCVKCSLAPVCLPEEARLGQEREGPNTNQQADPLKREGDNSPLEEKRKTFRLFPADDDRQILHVATPGSRIGRKGNRVEIVPPADSGEPPQFFPINEVSQIVLHGFAQISTQALGFCAEHAVGVHWLTSGGRYLGAWSSGAGSVQRRIRQYRALTDPEFCLKLSRQLVQARVRTQLSFLLRSSRESNRSSNEEDSSLKGEAITAIRRLLGPLSRATDIHSLRGYEGNVGAHYFRALPFLISDQAGTEMKPDGRSRRPPQDRANALLSFGYSLLLKDVLNAILVVGLDPSLGFYHQPRSNAHPLALDLMEMFRVVLVDLPVVASINRRQWEIDDDFTIAGSQVWLSDQGRKKLISIYERRKQDQWRHPVIGYSLSYSRLIELEVRLLEKEWMNEGGLFARLRLR